MTFNYNQYYKENPTKSLWEPFVEFIDFFQNYDKQNAKVLDLGAWQGRDAIFIAEMWHNVTAVDISEIWIWQVVDEATKKNLLVTWIISDILEYKSKNKFDIIIIDRTLHMLNGEDMIKVLQNIKNNVKEWWYILIADEKKNIWIFKKFFEDINWNIILNNKWFLFIKNN